VLAAGQTNNPLAFFRLPARFDRILPRLAIAVTNRLVFAIYADGRPITRSAPLSSSDKPTPLRAPLGPVRSISLRVEAGFPTTATGSGLWLDPVRLAANKLPIRTKFITRHHAS
jgi:hypothetical protein